MTIPVFKNVEGYPMFMMWKIQYYTDVICHPIDK